MPRIRNWKKLYRSNRKGKTSVARKPESCYTGSMSIDNFDPNSIVDEQLRDFVKELLNVLEAQQAEIKALRGENQQLRDEINRLKGEKGQPKFKASRQKSGDVSSESERRERRRQRKGRKHDQIEIDQEIVLPVDGESLPGDAQFKGYAPHIVQDIEVRTNNTRFLREKYYSPSEGKTYTAPMPAGYEGEFGPVIHAQVLMLHFAGNMTHSRIHDWLTQLGIKISTGQISRWLSDDHDPFHAEAQAAYEANLAECPWQHIDETGTRVSGDNRHCHITSSPLGTHFHTLDSKSRQAALQALQKQDERHYLLNEEALGLMKKWKIPDKHLGSLECHFPREVQSQSFTESWLDEHFKLNTNQRRQMLDALAIAAYHTQTDLPVVQLLIADDAPQFRYLTAELALCWVHEGRHYKKLKPALAYHRNLQGKFLRLFWRYYRCLKRYQEHPTPQAAARLSHQFDRLFAIRTGYDALDKLIARTQAHKVPLLMVLHHPEIPLNNNPAELGARRRVCKRRVSYSPNSEQGLRAWDTFMSLAATTQALDISFFHYLRDRLMNQDSIPPLAEIIRTRATTLNLSGSWQVAATGY